MACGFESVYDEELGCVRIFLPLFYVLSCLNLETIIAEVQNVCPEKYAPTELRTRIADCRIIRTLQAWRLIYVLTSSLPATFIGIWLSALLSGKYKFLYSNFINLVILRMPYITDLPYSKEGLHFLHTIFRNHPRLLLPTRLLHRRRLRKNNSMLN